MTLANVKYTPNYATGLRFITSTTFSGASSVSIDNCFSAQYQHYLIMRDLLGSSANETVSIRLRAGGTDATGQNYRLQYLYVSGGTVVGSRVTALGQFNYALGYTESTKYGFSRTWISNPFESVRTTLWSDHTYAAGDPNMQTAVYAHDLTTSYDGFTAFPNAGTFTGTIVVYGLREAR